MTAKHADGAVPVGAELVRDDAGSRRHERPAAESLECAQDDELVDVRRQAAAQGGDGEQDHRAEEQALATVDIAERARYRHGHDLAEGVDRDRPGRPVDGGVQVVLEGTQRGGHDRRWRSRLVRLGRGGRRGRRR
jgi:hypothetical protein